MTEAIYLEVTEMAETAHKAKRRVSVSGMLKHLGVSRSGYHAWLKRVPSNTEKRREAVKAKIQDIYDESKQNYGAPKITKEFRKSGEIISERTVGKYMKQMGIKAQWVKPWTITTKDSDFSSELKNILDEQFNPERPNAVWCSDITYIWTIDGFVYLTSIMDLYSRKIIAWTLSKTLEVSCVIETIKKAKARRNIDKPLILHSDRGSLCEGDKKGGSEGSEKQGIFRLQHCLWPRDSRGDGYRNGYGNGQDRPSFGRGGQRSDSFAGKTF